KLSPHDSLSSCHRQRNQTREALVVDVLLIVLGHRAEIFGYPRCRIPCRRNKSNRGSDFSAEDPCCRRTGPGGHLGEVIAPDLSWIRVLDPARRSHEWQERAAETDHQAGRVLALESSGHGAVHV